ncbi:LytR/AlgR family response regulator transcription factor [Spirosoma montaniterrae]|uniref:Two-component system response regulator n=1 Tax=Spirosoma montaniterrae TaxID=1178516 RepID=A0A1P9WUC8_9BACT|nr:LytTR family DNA-binding domain-containing protein [Spirosoma montaniterrae]AQG78984.1 two-component system response regulator [Spirosoma montaniterrae]
MTKLRCIAIDDEPFALDMLADDIRKVPFLDLIDQFSSPLEAYDRLQQNNVDLLFLDIQMPTLTGIQFLRTLTQPPMVILTTAYEQYALEGYDLDVVDYLLKPIPFERFMKAVTKARELFRLRQPALQTNESTPPVADTPEPQRTFFFIFSEYREIRIFHDEVLYVEGLKDYVKIFTTQQPRPLLSRLTLKAIEAKLPADRFCRVHKSFIVALDKISSFQRTNLYIGRQEIPVGSSYADEFIRRYGA